MKLRLIVVLSCVLAIPAGFYLWWTYPGWIWYVYPGNPQHAEVKARFAVAYETLYEDNGSLIQIGVTPDIDRKSVV